MEYTFSHKGKRKSNQDYLFSQSINPSCVLHLVADGMGGYDYGDIASKLVAENVYTYLSTVNEINEKEIQKAVNKSNLIIKQKSDDLNTKIGATLAGVITFKNRVFLFWVGDVKIVYVRNREILFETHSHTLINDMIKNGNTINKIERYKHIVTRSVSGNIKNSFIDYHSISHQFPNDLILIYSDGVSDLLSSYQICSILNSSFTVQEGIKKIETLCKSEAKDNFSMIIIEK
ncbi:protein phosphatase [Flavobacterium nitrogenifigens]|uniref:Protein phosphatase n=2 Tax=Flavobacterium TaxID=237 RepID=A0A7W7J1J2_9FLAO|nr:MULTISPECIES: protein phosphatase 2C domain-containing protein [Flavobacterium]MBB4804370.1 protein phosphatase [Flavobacterium nitrogenifigens]MBB6389234.1 protein phosphatase [Flavobacterium notoginsengisoli]